MSKSWRVALVVGVLVAVAAATSAGAAKFITGADIRNGSIGLRDLSRAARRALRGAAGAAGPAGPQGPVGSPGPAGPSSLSTALRSAVFVAPADDFAEGEVRCPDGMVATGGSLSPGALVAVFDGPSGDGRGWVGSALDVSGQNGFRMLLTVVCTPGAAQTTAASAVDGARAALETAAQDAR